MLPRLFGVNLVVSTLQISDNSGAGPRQRPLALKGGNSGSSSHLTSEQVCVLGTQWENSELFSCISCSRPKQHNNSTKAYFFVIVLANNGSQQGDIRAVSDVYVFKVRSLLQCVIPFRESFAATLLLLYSLLIYFSLFNADVRHNLHISLFIIFLIFIFIYKYNLYHYESFVSILLPIKYQFLCIFVQNTDVTPYLYS